VCSTTGRSTAHHSTAQHTRRRERGREEGRRRGGTQAGSHPPDHAQLVAAQGQDLDELRVRPGDHDGRAVVHRERGHGRLVHLYRYIAHTHTSTSKHMHSFITTNRESNEIKQDQVVNCNKCRIPDEHKHKPWQRQRQTERGREGEQILICACD
jgi:hypothetical protein